MTPTIRSTDESLDGTIATYSGGTFKPLTPDPADIRIEDIVHALSNQCRFTGHTRDFYSVGQHSYHCAEMVRDWLIDAGEYDPVVVLTTLMHDASEYALADISRPIKMVPEFGDVYKKFEVRLEIAIAERFGLIYPYPDIVKRADNALLRTEQRDLMPDVFLHAGDDFYPDHLFGWSPGVARFAFQTMFNRLQDEIAALPGGEYTVVS